MLKKWGIPVLLAFIIVMGLHLKFLANSKPGLDRLQDYLQTNQLLTGVDVIRGYQQVYYQLDGTKFYLTDSESNHNGVSSSHEFIVWQESINGIAQIFIHNVLANTTIQLTTFNFNTHPQVDSGRVVWETATEEGSKVLYYDGLEIVSLSNPDTLAIRPSIQGNQVIFAESNGKNWQTNLFNTATKKTTVLKTGNEREAGWPHFVEGRVETTFQ